MSKAERDIRRKLPVLKHYEGRGNVAKTCRHFGIARQPFYGWKKNYEKLGNEGLVNHKPCPENPRLRRKSFTSVRPIIWGRSGWAGLCRATTRN